MSSTDGLEVEFFYIYFCGEGVLSICCSYIDFFTVKEITLLPIYTAEVLSICSFIGDLANTSVPNFDKLSSR